MSDSVTPRRQPTRLPHPWDSSGKNTGVGCHFLLQCMKVKSESEVAQLYPTLSDPMDCSLPGSSVHGIFQARALEWGAIAVQPGATQFLPVSLSFLICKLELITVLNEITHSRAQCLFPLVILTPFASKPPPPQNFSDISALSSAFSLTTLFPSECT